MNGFETAPPTGRVEHALERLARATVAPIGSLLAAIGLGTVIVQFTIWRSQMGGSHETPMYVAFGASAVALFVLRKGAPVGASRRRTELTAFAREVLRFLLVFLFMSSMLMSRFLLWEQHAAVAGMKSDLRNLVALETAAKQATGAYTTNIDALVSSPGIARPRVAAAEDGWSASVEHAGTAQRCTVYEGAQPADLANNNQGKPKCSATGLAPIPWSPILVGLAMLGLGVALGMAARTLRRNQLEAASAG